jgi:hypothetical protein
MQNRHCLFIQLNSGRIKSTHLNSTHPSDTFHFITHPRREQHKIHTISSIEMQQIRQSRTEQSATIQIQPILVKWSGSKFIPDNGCYSYRGCRCCSWCWRRWWVGVCVVIGCVHTVRQRRCWSDVPSLHFGWNDSEICIGCCCTCRGRCDLSQMDELYR